MFSIIESLIWTHKCRLGNKFWFLCNSMIMSLVIMMRLIRNSDYAHIRIRICIRIYPNIFADADIKLHMYPIPKSAWEKKRMANSNELLCANRCRLGREGGEGNTHPNNLFLPFLSNHLSLRCSIEMRRKSLQFIAFSIA